jgi:putative phosphoesterase
MKVGILSDAHGNWKALEKCLLTLQKFGVEVIYFLGDAVGYLPGEKKVLDLLAAFQVHCQKGNHEALLTGELVLSKEEDRIYGLSEARQRLSPKNQQILQKWPENQELSWDGKKILMVHGSPNNTLQGYVYPDTDFSFALSYPYDVIFMGHTHYPFSTRYQNKLIVNVGSCGLPRDQGNMAAFAVYDSLRHHAEIYRMQFDWREIVEDFEQGLVASEVVESFQRSTPSMYGKVIE